MEDLFSYPEIPGASRVDTSIAAAENIKPSVGALRQAVLDALETYGPQTTEDLEQTTGIDYATVQPRTSELKALGLIEDSGSRRKNHKGRNIVVWQIVTNPNTQTPKSKE